MLSSEIHPWQILKQGPESDPPHRSAKAVKILRFYRISVEVLPLPPAPVGTAPVSIVPVQPAPIPTVPVLPRSSAPVPAGRPSDKLSVPVPSAAAALLPAPAPYPAAYSAFPAALSVLRYHVPAPVGLLPADGYATAVAVPVLSGSSPHFFVSAPVPAMPSTTENPRFRSAPDCCAHPLKARRVPAPEAAVPARYSRYSHRPPH